MGRIRQPKYVPGLVLVTFKGWYCGRDDYQSMAIVFRKLRHLILTVSLHTHTTSDTTFLFTVPEGEEEMLLMQLRCMPFVSKYKRVSLRSPQAKKQKT